MTGGFNIIYLSEFNEQTKEKEDNKEETKEVL